MDDNNLECYICLDPISNNINANTYVLECCKNPVHLHCLQQWYNTNKIVQIALYVINIIVFVMI